ncbi:MAG: histidine phosphatase family protein [Treponema sp.]|nr:histidine phosphatase family protein [Treponema sp.]
MEVYIIRHGKTDWNKECRFQGAKDIPLNEEGREAARKLGERLKDVHFDIVFSSPLSRAYETACIVAHSAEKCDLLTEISFGEFEGVPFDEWMNTDEPRKYFFDKPGLYVPPKGGETFQHGCERAEAFIHTVLEPYYKKNPDARVMIVAHGAILAALMCVLENRGIDNFWGQGLKGNCEETIYTYDGNTWKLASEEKPQQNPYMKIVSKSSVDSVKCTVQVLKNGGVVIIPTDTVYGFSGIVSLNGALREPQGPQNSTDDRIRKIKGREETKPFIQLIARPEDLQLYTNDTVPPELLSKWPGALTIIVNNKQGGTTAYRCPGDEWLRNVISECGAPIYSTSVNRSGQPVLDEEAAIINEFTNEVELIIKDGDKKGAKPSTLVSIVDGEIKILRQGPISV